MRKIILLSSFILITIVSGKAADNNIFKYQKTATSRVDVSRNADISVIQFDSPFFARTANLYRDLRISTPDGIDIPFVVKPLTISSDISDWQSCPSTIIALRKVNNSVILEVEQNIKHNQPLAVISRLKIITSNRNFEKSIRLEVSND